MSVTRPLLELLLRLAPPEFREQCGAELMAVHVERGLRRRRGVRRWWFAVREIAGMVVLVSRLRLDGRGRPASEPAEGRRGVTVLETTGQDVRYAIRMLRRNPGFGLAAVAVLGLGIGATTAIFSAANAFFFRPLPFRDAERLVMLYETNPEFNWTDAYLAPANALDWREQVEAFEDVALYSEFEGRVVYVRNGEPELLGLAQVSGNFFEVLGVPAVVGRTPRWEETWEGRDDVVVLSHDLWRTHFGSDASIVGRQIELGSRTVEVLGVMPRGFTFPGDGVQLWTPFGWPESNREQVFFRRAHWVRGIARVAPGVSLAEADAQLQVVVQRLQQTYPETNRVMGAGQASLRDFLIRDVRRTLLVLLGAVTLLLLLACTNVANLLLVRANGRRREIALRHVLGAGRARVARQMLTESLILAVGGGAAGLGIGWAGVRLMQRLSPVGIEGATVLALDHRVVLFTFAVSVASAVLFGMAPALRTSGGRMHETLKEGGRGRTTSRESNRVTGTLVAAEVALALLLATGAGLMVRSFWLLRHVDPGFRTDDVIAVQFNVPAVRYRDRAEVLDFQQRFAEALEARPGIDRVGLIGQLPLNGTSWSSQFQARGWPPDRLGFEILHRRADNGYFEALDIPLIRGRLFEPTDPPDGPYVVVINETFAREHFPGEDPIGQWIAYDRAAGPESTWYQIVGIVGDQQQTTPRDPARAEVFENARQDWERSNWVVVRTAAGADAVIPTIRATLRELDPLIPLADIRALRDVWRRSMAREQFVLVLLGVFAAMALLLAVVGVYGVTAQALRRRTSEIGVRMALGAGAPDVVGLMLRQALGVVAVGLVAGLGAALLLARALRSLLYGVQPGDPGTLAAVAALLGGVALFASWLPARRASGVDPAISLREE